MRIFLRIQKRRERRRGRSDELGKRREEWGVEVEVEIGKEIVMDTYIMEEEEEEDRRKRKREREKREGGTGRVSSYFNCWKNMLTISHQKKYLVLLSTNEIGILPLSLSLR